MLRLASSLIVVSALVAACGGDPKSGPGSTCTDAGTASVSGTLLGNAFAARDAVAFPTGASSGFIIVTDFSGACTYVGTTDAKASSNVISFDFAKTAIAAGTFDTTSVEVQYAQFDAKCSSPQGESASSGSVTISSADSKTVTGTFDLVFSSDHVTGSFTAPLLAQAATSSAPSVCR
jgi:hypothetical protein